MTHKNMREGYNQAMKKPPESPTFARFTSAMQTIMKVPKTAVPKPAKGQDNKPVSK